MKKTIAFALAAMLGFGAVNAQAILEEGIEPREDQTLVDNGLYLAEQLDNGTITLDEIKDASFITEEMAQQLDAAYQQGGNQVVGALLAIFLGDFGIHHFYTGDTKHGLLHLLFCWTGIPGLIGLIEGIIWLVDSGSYGTALIDMF